MRGALFKVWSDGASSSEIQGVTVVQAAGDEKVSPFRD
jgi:hypothetical protein